jgi:DNA-binding beta-propeller fold protein YncE
MSRRFLLASTSAFVMLAFGPGTTPRGGPLDRLTAELVPAQLVALAAENACFDTAQAPVEPGLQPARRIADAYPTFLGVAVDPENGRVVMSDSGMKGLLMYTRTAGTAPGVDQVTKPLTDVRGTSTEIGFVAGVALDRARREKYTVNNDGGDKVVVFDYDATGNVAPKRELLVTHQAWGVALDGARDEMAVTIEISNQIEFYAREATGTMKPKRMIRGDRTGLADPHGIIIDNEHDEIVVANHGNWTSMAGFESGTATSRAAVRNGTNGSTPRGGRFLPPSIRVFAGSAQGDATPIRVIEGMNTGLNWPMSIDVDTKNDEIAVANSGDNRVLVFRRSDKGNVAPIRAIGGSRTGLSGPMGVAIDATNDELWVTNYSDHSALVFARTAAGDIAPKRVVRNAPIGTPSVGFGNPGAVAYDSKRDEILVPN